MSYAHLVPHQFGQPDGVDHDAVRPSIDKRKPWSIRRRVDKLMTMAEDAGMTGEVTRNGILDLLRNSGRPVKIADHMAAARIARALNGSDLSLQAVEDIVDGKLKDVIEHQIKPLELTPDERAARLHSIMCMAQQRKLQSTNGSDDGVTIEYDSK